MSICCLACKREPITLNIFESSPLINSQMIAESAKQDEESPHNETQVDIKANAFDELHLAQCYHKEEHEEHEELTWDAGKSMR